MESIPNGCALENSLATAEFPCRPVRARLRLQPGERPADRWRFHQEENKGMEARRSLLSLAMAVLAAIPAAAADTYTVDKTHSETLFTVKHLMSRVTGRFSDFSGTINVDPGNPAASTVEFTINAASVDTTVPDRDKDLRGPNFFDVERHPTITFKSSKVTPVSKDKFTVDGTLTMHGVSRPVNLAVEFLGFGKDPWGNEKAGFAVETTLNRKDYGLLWNKALDQGGFLLGDEVKVVINLEAAKKKS
jgi:polyisoprenoid-binding protein YceI